eukprot:m.281600 g.281600  ORF g.281600 m.281600 type:complete len:307 (+) comp19841_c0_seq8:236-1156(+)
MRRRSEQSLIKWSVPKHFRIVSLFSGVIWALMVQPKRHLCKLCTQVWQTLTCHHQVSSGLRDAGYTYLNLDDCYVGSRAPNGTLLPDFRKFPSGMRDLSDYVHSKGLLFGVYTARCTNTCAGRPASMHHEVEDAHTFSDLWNVDYVKEDSCSGCGKVNATEQYATMSAALNATGRHILFDMCWGCITEIELRPAIGNSWRIGPDDGNWNNVLININIDSELAEYAGPGHWNNPCLLISFSDDGSETCTALQSRTQFSAYAILAAPLMISGTVLHMSKYTLETYVNKEVIAVSQDPLGKQVSLHYAL